MKATGIVRTTDRLGRIVIPKELRKTYNINTGDPLEIFAGNNGEIIFKPYFNKTEIFKTDITAQLRHCKTIDSNAAVKIILSAYEKIIENSDFRNIQI